MSAKEESTECDCDVCQIWGSGKCEEVDPNFDPNDI